MRLKERSRETVNSYVDSLTLLPAIQVAPAAADGTLSDDIPDSSDIKTDHYRILDGIHRYLAHKQADSENISVEILDNVTTESQAIEHGITANSAHGVPLTAAEIKHNCIRLCELGRTNTEIADVVQRHATVVGKYTKATRERQENKLADKIGKLYDIRDDNGKRIYTHAKLASDIGQSTHRVSDLLDRYYANQIKLALEIREFTDQELRDQFSISEKQLTRVVGKYRDEIYPPKPEPEPEDVEKEVVEAVAEPELTTAPEAQEHAEAESDVDEDEEKDEESKRKHTEIEYKLLWLGDTLGLSVWVATDDRKKSYEGIALSDLPGVLSFLPSNIRAKTPQSIERIDVLWLHDNNIVAAFEVEHKTSIDSGLLKMSDMLVAMAGTAILTFIVAPNRRLDEARKKMNRPTFKATGQTDSCRFIPYSDLTDKYKEVKQIRSIACDWQTLLDEISYKL